MGQARLLGKFRESLRKVVKLSHSNLKLLTRYHICKLLIAQA